MYTTKSKSSRIALRHTRIKGTSSLLGETRQTQQGVASFNSSSAIRIQTRNLPLWMFRGPSTSLNVSSKIDQLHALKPEERLKALEDLL